MRDATNNEQKIIDKLDYQPKVIEAIAKTTRQRNEYKREYTEFYIGAMYILAIAFTLTIGHSINVLTIVGYIALGVLIFLYFVNNFWIRFTINPLHLDFVMRVEEINKVFKKPLLLLAQTIIFMLIMGKNHWALGVIIVVAFILFIYSAIKNQEALSDAVYRVECE